MPKTMRFLALALCLVIFSSLVPAVSATEAAQDITKSTQFSGTGYGDFAFLKDKNIKSYKTSTGNTTITLQNDAGIGSLYLLFDLEYSSYTVTDTHSGKSITGGELGILHEFLDLAEAFGSSPTSVTLTFANGAVRLSEIYVFTTGETPDFVQKWTAPLDGGADIVLFSTHGDDDQLYFAGLIPLYASAKKARVQVVYMTDHRTGPYATKVRKHEMLNGLWASGLAAYPVFGTFEDFRVDSLQGTYDEYKNTYGVTQDQLQSFVVEQIRRFKPLVAVGHDINGEYGHGMHQVYTDLLIKSLELTGDSSAFPESAEKYGTWELPKLYLHIYWENTIVLDIDTPLEDFDGLTAFQVAQKRGFPCHETQQSHGFYRWLNGRNNEITSSSQIETYNPAHYGLYHSTVGPDTGNDFLENVTTYAEQERIEQERLEQEEQERLEQERLEQERLEQERLEQERLEQERLEQEKQQALEQQKQNKQQAARQRRGLIITLVILGVLVLCEVIVVLQLIRRKKKKKTR